VLKNSGFVHFGRKKDICTKHKLRADIVELRDVREFLPHRSHDGLCSLCHGLESRVQVVNQVVPYFERGTNYGLDSF